MKIKFPFAAAVAVILFTALSAGAVDADTDDKEANKAPAEKRFQICMMPFSCSGKGPGKNIPKPENKAGEEKKDAPKDANGDQLNRYTNTDPLSQTILRGSMRGNGGGVVTAIRLKPAFTGVKTDQILYRGKSSLSLPGTPITSGPKTGNGGAGAEWVMVDAKGKAGKQVNSMREERVSLSGNAAESRQGLERMWQKKKSGS